VVELVLQIVESFNVILPIVYIWGNLEIKFLSMVLMAQDLIVIVIVNYVNKIK